MQTKKSINDKNIALAKTFIVGDRVQEKGGCCEDKYGIAIGTVLSINTEKGNVCGWKGNLFVLWDNGIRKGKVTEILASNVVRVKNKRQLTRKERWLDRQVERCF